MSCRFLLLILLLFAAWSTSIFALAGAITTGTWLSKTPMQIGRNCELAVVNGKIYAVGGDATGFLGTNEEYDPATDTWVFKAAMPTPRGHFGIAVYQNKIYCIGGYAAGGATVINEVYDPATDKWETKAPMPTPRLNLQANVVNGKIYLMGGSPNGTLNEVYDPVNNTWLTKKSIPKATDSAKVGIGNKIYVISSGLNQIYDCETDNWSVGASPPLPVTLAKAAATTGVNAPMRIYVFGIDADMPFWQISFRNFTAQSYDPKNDSWTVCAFMPKGRYSASVALVDDRLYVIGGYTLESLAAEFTLNRLIKPSAVNEHYTPEGYGTIPPAVNVVSPENKTYNANNVPLTCVLNKQAIWMTYTLDGKDNVTISSNSTITGLAVGVHNITVFAKDANENIGASKNVTFTIAPPLFPTIPIASLSAALASIAVAGLLVYFKKCKH